MQIVQNIHSPTEISESVIQSYTLYSYTVYLYTIDLIVTVARRGHFQLNLPNMKISKQHHFQNAIFPNLLPRRAQIIVELVKQRKVAGQYNFVDDLL